MNQTLIIIRGPQGAGKTTLAKALSAQYKCRYVEADQFHTDPITGKYLWDPKQMGSAHAWCREEVRKELVSGSTVIVSNTTITKKELDPYLEMAKELGIPVWEIIAWGKFENIHGVPESKVQEKRESFYLNK